ncbi:SDR family NAD(P)-dependent oxidoreductase [Candidatus Gottesmanbacteria bacterium]|nr:SDR family NAD(P)-dependent oxidoreductase [Candidatus Gottesmanbacteria bacterium]
MKQKELVLVTGGAGFIGSHLVDALIDKGYRVRVLDNLAPPVHNGNLPDWCNKKAECMKGDVRKKKDWQAALTGVDYVFHLAAYMDYHVNFSKYIDTNIRSTALLYEIIVEHKLPIKKIVVASSQSVYGEGKYLCAKHGVLYAQPRPESQLTKHQWEVRCPKDGTIATLLPEVETDELHPQIPYAISKVASEKLCLNLGKTYRIPTVALRYSIVQGSRQSFRHFYSGALRDFAVRALAGLPIVMQEDGRQIRDFVNVHDVVDAHLLVLRNKHADYQVFNVGMGRNTRVVELAKAVCRIAGTAFKPSRKGEYRINSPRHSKMNIDRLKKLGFAPKHTLEDSVREYIDWVRHYPEAISYWKRTYGKMRRDNILKP